MFILSFRCVVTEITKGTESSRRRTWIAASDFRALALAATREIGSSPEACAYALFRPDVPRPATPHVFLEVVCERASALVGPMGGPRPPATLAADRFYGFAEFLRLLGLIDGPGDVDPIHSGLPTGTYPVTVRFAGIWHHEPTSVAPPIREPHESAAAFRARCEVVEQRRIARSRHEGLHVVSYPVAARRWRAYDLDRLMGLAYGLLPASEPRWRQSGTIVRRPVSQEAAGSRTLTIGAPVTGTATGAAGPVRRTRRRRSPWPPCISYLEVGRGEYVASLEMPEFPAHGLVDWLKQRPCEISLCHAVDLLEQHAGGVSLFPRTPRPPRLGRAAA